MFTVICTCMHVCVYMCMYWGWAKTNEGSHMFLSMLLIGYRKSLKLDYCFIMSTRLNVVPVAVSIQNRHRWTQFSWNTITLLTTCLDCRSAHVQTLMWPWQ